MKIFTNLVIIILATLSMSSHASHCFSTDMERNRMKILRCFETQSAELKQNNQQLQQRITEFSNHQFSRLSELTNCLETHKNALIPVLRCVEAKLDRLKDENRQLQQTIIQLSRVNWSQRGFDQAIAVCLSPDLSKSQIEVFECFEAKLVELKNENQQLQQMITDLSKQNQTFQDRLRDGSLGPKMVKIPSGRFRMGDIQGWGDSDEQPVHWVSVDGFAMGQYELTFAEYDKFAEATGRRKPSDDGWGRGNRPVINVSWNDATAYTKWLSEQTGHTYRLPTEAEWEYAARAGTETKYWWGNDIGSNRANCNSVCGDSFEYTAPVGSFRPNQVGLYDTVGNVWEWTCSQYQNRYAGEEQQCADQTGYFVLRGGAWSDGAWWTRSADRNDGGPAFRSNYFGFRPARIK